MTIPRTIHCCSQRAMPGGGNGNGRIVWAGEEPKLITFPRESLGVVVLGRVGFRRRGYNELVETLKMGGYRAQIVARWSVLPDSFDYQVFLSSKSAELGITKRIEYGIEQSRTRRQGAGCTKGGAARFCGTRAEKRPRSKWWATAKQVVGPSIQVGGSEKAPEMGRSGPVTIDVGMLE